MPIYSPSLFVAVALGGALGSLLRYIIAISLVLSFPLGALSVNVIGCTLMGGISACFALRWPEYQQLRLFLTVGFLGGFTTFSSFALDIGQFADQGRYFAGFCYALASVLLSVLGFFIAQSLTRTLLT